MKENSALILQNSSFLKLLIMEREEILRHKWLESEKAGYDIGWDRALIDWTIKHRAKWLNEIKATTFLAGNDCI